MTKALTWFGLASAIWGFTIGLLLEAAAENPGLPADAGQAFQDVQVFDLTHSQRHQVRVKQTGCLHEGFQGHDP